MKKGSNSRSTNGSHLGFEATLWATADKLRGNDTKTLEQIFNEAKLTPKNLEDLIVAAAGIVNKVRREAGLSQFDVGAIGDVVHTHTDNILLALATPGANGQK